MKELKIKCPVTGTMIKTGVIMDVESFAISVLERVSVKCSACGGKHFWSKADVGTGGS